MKIYDISLPISPQLVSWPGDPSPKFTNVLSIHNGNNCNVTKLEMGVHTGTHIDAPYHFIENGAKSDEIDLSILLGRCLVIEVLSDHIINLSDIECYKLENFDRVLFKTSNSNMWKIDTTVFHKNFISLSLDAANHLINGGIKLIGIDYLSIESFNSKTHKVHKKLLSSNVIILEGVDLSDVNAGVYELICLPIKLVGCDGSPVRAILKDFDFHPTRISADV